ncbi:hypothetical protein [Moorena producens]|uniref:hypothetical protein n=1 Tax=Moorena producens TaxID=1155739 RepID=UPI000AAD5FE3|nr:hypothetical protein [Moorena producens]
MLSKLAIINPYCLLPVACCLLPIAYCLLPVACCLLPLASCLLPLASCLLPTPHSLIFHNCLSNKQLHYHCAFCWHFGK